MIRPKQQKHTHIYVPADGPNRKGLIYTVYWLLKSLSPSLSLPQQILIMIDSITAKATSFLPLLGSPLFSKKLFAVPRLPRFRLFFRFFTSIFGWQRIVPSSMCGSTCMRKFIRFSLDFAAKSSQSRPYYFIFESSWFSFLPQSITHERIKRSCIYFSCSFATKAR